MGFKNFVRQFVAKHQALLNFVDLGRSIIAPNEQYSLWKDYCKTFRENIFLREHRSISGKKHIVLIVLASDMVYEAKLLAMLALGLKLKDCNIKVLMSRVCLWAKRYFKTFGINDFVYWEDFELSAKEKSDCAGEMHKFLSDELNMQSVKKWKYRSAWIGPQIISSVSRKLMKGAPDLQNKEMQKLLIDLLPQTLETVHLAEKMLEKIQPQTMVLIEANYTLMGALTDTAISRGVSVIQTVQPSRDDAMIFKRLNLETRRIHPSSVSKSSMEIISKMAWIEKNEQELMQEFSNRYGGKWFLQSRNQPGVKEKSKEEIIQQLKLDPDKKIVVVFSPVLWDANLFYGEDLFEDFGDWFIQTVRAARKNPNVHWIIKMHPANLWKRARENTKTELAEVVLIKENIGDLPPHVKLLYPNTDISTWSLFKACDYGITVRGTIGMELPCFGVPVFTAGTGRYSGLGFTIDSETKEQYLDRLSKIHTYEAMTQEEILAAKRHAYAAFKLRTWQMKSFRAVFNYRKRGIHPLDHNLLMQARDLEEIKKNGDLEKWATWALSNEIDYLDSSKFPPAS